MTQELDPGNAGGKESLSPGYLPKIYDRHQRLVRTAQQRTTARQQKNLRRGHASPRRPRADARDRSHAHKSYTGAVTPNDPRARL